MTRWGLFLAGYAIGLAVFNLIRSAVSGRMGSTEPSTTPVLPSAMDDWDEEFKRLTGVSPFPEIVIRSGATEVTTHRLRDYEHQPGDVAYYRGRSGYSVLSYSPVEDVIIHGNVFVSNND